MGLFDNLVLLLSWCIFSLVVVIIIAILISIVVLVYYLSMKVISKDTEEYEVFEDDYCVYTDDGKPPKKQVKRGGRL